MLLDDIITILSDSNGSLTDALLKTKVLLYQIGKKDLATWVSNELTGYPDDVEVPPYRIVGSEVRGHVRGMAFDAPDYALPIQHLKPETRKDLQSSKIQMSIESIEQSVQSYRAKGGGLRRNMPTEFGALFQKVLTSGTNVWSSWCAINMVEVENILSEVRSRLLDFALELKDALGDVPQKDLLQKANEVHADRIFTTAIYNTGGTVIVGSTNIQVNNQQGDIEGLLKEVAKLGYDQKELEELRQAVIEDKGKNETPTVTEGKTGKWYLKALKKVGKGTVRVGVDIVTGVIVKALEHYAKGA
jgi:hypothetical protein